MFQKEIDATQPFVLRVMMMRSPSGWNAPLVFVAQDSAGKVIAVNPTMVAVPGAALRFQMYNCLTKADIETLKQYDPLDPASVVSPDPNSFQAFQAPEMQPTGYVNIHTHGLHGSPVSGTPTSAAGDEVLVTFLSPFGNPAVNPSVSNRQSYRILVPKNQDPGLNWYHPHLHGEAQPQVFLGLTGAVIVVPKLPGDPSGHASITAELKAHADPSSHPAVFVVRDYPVDHFPVSQTGGVSAATRAPFAEARTGTRKSFRLHRERYLRDTAGATAQAAAAPDATPAIAGPLNPLCSLFQAPGTNTPCLPDAVTSTSTDPPSLATLVTVNGRMTETPTGDTGDGTGPKSLTFQPLSPAASDRVIRVLNASANTYIKLSLSTAPLTSITLSSAPTQVVSGVPLVQLRRDGAPVPHALRSVNYIMLPPGGRAEFSAAETSPAPLSLVSQYVNTGPAGDLVPPRSLSLLGTTPAVAPTQNATDHLEFSTRFQGAYKPLSAGETRRAFAFYEQDRICQPVAPGQPQPDCGTTFYLMDITASAIGIAGHKTSVTQAIPFNLPMGADGAPTRDLFQANGRLKSSTPSVQVALRGQREVDEEWDIYNFTGEAHAFHIHQLGFRVTEACSAPFLATHAQDCLEDDGNAGDENHEVGLVMDVINVPPGYSQPAAGGSGPAIVYPSKVHIRIPFTDDIAGNFVVHCHLLEHEDNGMMMGVQVWKQDIPAQTASGTSSMTMP